MNGEGGAMGVVTAVIVTSNVVSFIPLPTLLSPSSSPPPFLLPPPSLPRLTSSPHAHTYQQSPADSLPPSVR